MFFERINEINLNTADRFKTFKESEFNLSQIKNVYFSLASFDDVI